MFSTQLCAEESISLAEQATEQRTITIKGKVDPRLSVFVRSAYRPSAANNNEECLKKAPDWGAGSQKGNLAFQFAPILPDIGNNYEASIPIDYVGENKCSYEYVRTDIEIRRDTADDLYASFTVTSNERNPRHIYQGTLTGSAGLLERPVMPENTKKYFQLPSGTEITCFTMHYERSIKNKGKKNEYVYPKRNVFSCFEEYRVSMALMN